MGLGGYLAVNIGAENYVKEQLKENYEADTNGRQKG
jgi:hypothetical protein